PGVLALARFSPMTLSAVWAAPRAETPVPKRDISLHPGFEEGTAQRPAALPLRTVTVVDARARQAGEQIAQETTSAVKESSVVVIELVGLLDQFDEVSMTSEQRIPCRLRQRPGSRAQRHL